MGIVSLTRDEIAKRLGGDDGRPKLGANFCFDWSKSFEKTAERQLAARAKFTNRACEDAFLAAVLWVSTTYMSGLVRGTGFQPIQAPFVDAQLPVGGMSPHCEMADAASDQSKKFLDAHPGSLALDIWFADGFTSETQEEQKAAIRRYRATQTETNTHCLVVALTENVNLSFLGQLSVKHEVVQCLDDDFDRLFDLILDLLRGLAKNPQAIDIVGSLTREEIKKLMDVTDAVKLV